MTFQEALVRMQAGDKVRRPNWVETDYLYLDEGVFVNEEEVEYPLTVQELSATDWEVVRPALRDLERNESYMTYSEDKQRWVSTTNPEKHLQAGKQVAIFSLLTGIN